MFKEPYLGLWEETKRAIYNLNRRLLWRTKYENWKHKKFSKCGFCHKNLFRYGNCYGGVDVKVNCSGSDKRTVYLCNLCYHLFSK